MEMEPFAVIPHDAKLFGAAANNGQMIAEIEPKGKIAEIFADLANEVAGRGEARKAKRGLSRSVHRQVRSEESLRAALKTGQRRRARSAPWRRRRREERACSASVPIPD